MKYEEFLTDEFVDVHDLMRWNQKQIENCNDEGYKFIFQKFQGMLERLKKSQDQMNFNKMFPPLEIVNNTSFIDTT